MRKFLYSLCFVIILGFLAKNYFYDDNKIFTRDGISMNTVIRISAYAKSNEPVDEAFELLEILNKSFSLYDKNSDISEINFNAGIKPVLNKNSFIPEILNRAREIFDLTDGVFNPLIGPITKLWKINQNDNTIPNLLSIDQALKLTDINNLVINSDSVFLKTNGAVLDLSGIAKGYASEKIAQMLEHEYKIKSALIDLGGNIFVKGLNPTTNSKWHIGIRDPLDKNNPPALILDITDTAIITSGNYERYKIIDGVKYSHFFNPVNGMPVKNDLLSVTVITPDATAADALATAFMITGIETAKKLKSKLPENLNVIFMRNSAAENQNPNVEIIASENLRNTIIKSNYPVKFF